MPADQPRGPSRGWKNKAAAPGAAGTGKRKWQTPQETPAGPKRPMSKNSKLTIAAATVGGIIAVIVLVILWFIPAKPACLVLVGAPFAEDLAVPHNVYGWKGLQDLASAVNNSGGVTSWWPWSSNKPLRLQAEPIQYVPDAKQSWVPQDIKEPTLLVFLALHGGSDRKGAYLIVNSNPQAPRLRLEKVLDDLNSPSLKDKNKVLILDATQVAEHWPSGLLHNDFARELKKLDEKIKKIGKMVVLCASDENQRSWTSEEWQQSVFAHYVIEGLKGAAAREGGRVIKARDLYDYVQRRVQAWAMANREAVQRPILLPLQGGEELASEIDLVQHPEEYPESGEVKKAELPSDLEVEWKTWARLQSETPSPVVYSPQLWRRYQDSLLRYEQLLRAGDPTRSAESLRQKLAVLKSGIVAGRRLHATGSLTNTLAMPTAGGLRAGWSARELRRRFDELWSAPADKRQEVWNKTRDWAKDQGEGSDETANLKLLRVDLTRQLLEKVVQVLQKTGSGPITEQKGPDKSAKGVLAAEKGPKLLPDLEKAIKLLNDMNSLGGERPVEAHYFIMLLRDLDLDSPKTQPPAADLALALKVSLLAENAALGRANVEEPPHPYSEFVDPWIHEKVHRADKDRRHGQDLLFGPQAQWKQARSDLEKALKVYQEAGSDANVVQQALDLRDEILAVLPYYAHWVAVQRADGADGLPEPRNALLARVESLGKKVDELAARLEAPPLVKDLASLRALSLEVKGQFENLRRPILDTCLQLTKQHAFQLPYLRQFEAALAGPLLAEPSDRMVLLKNCRELSFKTNDDFNRDNKAPHKAPDPAALATEEMENAKGQGRIAAAITGLAGRFLEGGNPAQWLNPPPAKWQDDIAMAGEVIADRYQKMRERIVKDFNEGLEARKLEPTAPRILVPEYLCRLVPGSADIPSEPFNPVEASRRLRCHDLLLSQAQRTLDDHWFLDSENSTATYYIPAAKAYLTDAEAMAEAKRDDEDVNKDRKATVRAKRDNDVVLSMLVAKKDPPPTQDVINDEFRVAWKLEAQKKLPLSGGVPTFWLEMDGPIKLVKDTDRGRKSLEPPLPPEVAFTLEKAKESKQKDQELSPQVQKGTARLRGIFRGQRIREDTPLQLHKDPEILIYKTIPPPAAGASLRLAEGFTYGAVSIIVDCTGTMRDPIKAGGKPKIDLAREALEKLLTSIPKGTWLSIAVFGHHTANNTKPAGPGNAQMEGTEIYWIRTCSEWDPTNKADGLISVMKQANRLEPQNFTPSVEALVVARLQGFPSKKVYEGPRVILMLTDGEDNLFKAEQWDGAPDTWGRQALWAKNANLKKYEEWYKANNNRTDFLKNAFRNSDIEVQVVCFINDKDKKNQQEVINAKNNFMALKDMVPPGRFFIQPEPKMLRKALEDAIRPTLRLLDIRTREPVRIRNGDTLPATAYGENTLEWAKAEPGLYIAQVQKYYEREIRLDRGHLLNITMKRDDRGVVFARGLLSDYVKEKKGLKARGEWYAAGSPWIASVAQNRYEPQSGLLTQLVAIETKQELSKKQEGTLHQVKPRFVWMELKAEGANQPKRFRWRDEFGFAAPTYRLQSPEWPANAESPTAPLLQVWWSDTTAEGEPLNHVPGPLNALLGKVNVGGNHVVVTSIKRDRRTMATRFSEDEGMAQADKKPCLVVEIQHDPGKPVWVRADGLGHLGEEHRFYTSAGMYTAIFWNVTNPEEKAFQLTVIPLDDFKRTAEAASHNATFRPSQPDRTDTGPDPTPLDTLR